MALGRGWGGDPPAVAEVSHGVFEPQGRHETAPARVIHKRVRIFALVIEKIKRRRRRRRRRRRIGG